MACKSALLTADGSNHRFEARRRARCRAVPCRCKNCITTENPQARPTHNRAAKGVCYLFQEKAESPKDRARAFPTRGALSRKTHSPSGRNRRKRIPKDCRQRKPMSDAVRFGHGLKIRRIKNRRKCCLNQSQPENRNRCKSGGCTYRYDFENRRLDSLLLYKAADPFRTGYRYKRSRRLKG